MSLKGSSEKRRHRRQRAWEDWAQIDPYYAVLSNPERFNGSWNENTSAFFQSGVDDVERLAHMCQEVGLATSWGQGLDFGCGIGRVTRALAGRCERVLGVDVSRTMVEHASRLNVDVPNIAFRAIADVDEIDDDSADLLYSHLVLQHLGSPAEIRRTAGSLCRKLRRGGVMLLGVPHSIPPRTLQARLRLRSRAYGLLRALGIPPGLLRGKLGLYPLMSMHAVPEPEMRELFATHRVEVRHVISYVGEDAIDYRQYLLRRHASA